MISILVAFDQNKTIGKNNDLPWHLPSDLKYVKNLTTSNTIIMGRKTYESIGKPLPNRENVVLTRQADFSAPGCRVIDNLSEVVEWNKENPDHHYFIFGGAGVFKDGIDITERMYITYIDEAFEGDTFFPEFNEAEWELISEEKGEKNEKNPYDYYYRVYDRIID